MQKIQIEISANERAMLLEGIAALDMLNARRGIPLNAANGGTSCYRSLTEKLGEPYPHPRDERPATRLECALIEQAAELLASHYSGGDNAVWCRAAAQLQILGAERAGLSANTTAACQKLLSEFERATSRRPS